MAKKLLALTLMAGLGLPIVAMAAEDGKKPPEKKETQEQKAKDKDAKKEDGKETKKPTIFKPSEELSEDYSVPFPTDI